MKCHTTLLKNSRKTLVKGEQNDDDPFSQTSFLDFSNTVFTGIRAPT